MSEETKNASSDRCSFPIHIGIKMAPESEAELEEAWRNGETPLNWDGSAIFRVNADLGGDDENGRIVFVYDFRSGDLLGIELTKCNPDAWSETNPMHCSKLNEDMWSPWDLTLYYLKGISREEYLAAYQEWIDRGAHSSDLSASDGGTCRYIPVNADTGKPADKAFNLAYNYRLNDELQQEGMTADQHATLAPYDSFAALYTESFNKWCDGQKIPLFHIDPDRNLETIEQLLKANEGMSREEIFSEAYIKPARWSVDESKLAEVVQGVLDALATLRTSGKRGWPDGVSC